ncbi:hypothetical protein M378DRAFT_433635 [Amanita muscaria Koide BX008]|uniref:Uncharacterized protein n=1 Tax=Amanita muscaria (strain Koide BX008) TaxID=946122 RepID=A0A0C2XBE5_AMAMK|nr:hypothetical protein M378DRAFT_433635 [Amanita muscaria Koide BX008]
MRLAISPWRIHFDIRSSCIAATIFSFVSLTPLSGHLDRWTLDFVTHLHSFIVDIISSNLYRYLQANYAIQILFLCP